MIVVFIQFTLWWRRIRGLWKLPDGRDWLRGKLGHILMGGAMLSSVQFSSVTQSCPTLCDPMDCSMSGFPVHHQIPEFTQTRVHWVRKVIHTSHPVTPFSSCLQSFLASGSFPMSQLFASGGQSIGASASVLAMNIQSWFPLRLTGLISLLSKGLSRVFSSTIIWKHQFFSTQPSLCSTLKSVHDYWKNHSFDYANLCQQSDVCAF